MTFLTWFYCNPPGTFVNPFCLQGYGGAENPRKRTGNDWKVEEKGRYHFKNINKVGKQKKNRDKSGKR